jgi:nodulation protein E
MTNPRRVVITGLGAVSALGNGVAPFWEAMAGGRGGIGPIQGFEETSLRMSVAAQAASFDPAQLFSPQELPLLDRHSQFALAAAKEAVADASLPPESLARSAAIIGTGCGGKETDEQTYSKLYRDGKSRAHPLTIPRGMPSAAASQVSMQLGVRGPVFTVSSACASSNHAVAQAAMLIRSGVVDLALAGGADAPFTYGLLKAWEAMRVVSSDTCRPFSADRSGMVLGEGAGIVVLESEQHARERNARIYAELAGVGMSSDAGHITDPSPEGAALAMESALRDAGIHPESVDYINAHGTGTLANDVSETRALHSVFGGHAGNLAISSTKSMHGHALGASGGMELIATVLALKNDLVPPTINFTSPGEGCDLDYVPNRSLERKLSVALSNSFAFGGLNAVLALRKH